MIRMRKYYSQIPLEQKPYRQKIIFLDINCSDDMLGIITTLQLQSFLFNFFSNVRQIKRCLYLRARVQDI